LPCSKSRECRHHRTEEENQEGVFHRLLIFVLVRDVESCDVDVQTHLIVTKIEELSIDSAEI
jgi:hypothetical protein